MKVYNNGKISKVLIVFLLIGLPSSLILVFDLVWNALIATIIVWPIAFLYCKTMFCSFIINEKGITRQLFGRSLFSAWKEFNYIGVGERPVNTIGEAQYSFTLYFSKIPPEKIYFRDTNFEKQDKKFYSIRYREGLLEEVLKYVDENRIKDIERIRECPDPDTPQLMETSKGSQRRRFWD